MVFGLLFAPLYASAREVWPTTKPRTITRISPVRRDSAVPIATVMFDRSSPLPWLDSVTRRSSRRLRAGLGLACIVIGGSGRRRWHRFAQRRGDVRFGEVARLR